MERRHQPPFSASEQKGFRLHKLEVFNWGTFDGQVFTVRPAGKSALLIGQNGSGKSTLVDALLTLMVKPGLRNFNVASGAKKRERDERSYVRGAYDRGSGDDGSGIQVRFLRPKGDHYSVILSCFRDSDSGESFTIAQLLYLLTDLTVQKIHCMSDGERSIQEDFGGLESTDGVLRTLRDRNFQATKTFQDFEGWFRRKTQIKPKAMEVFNQTVAVKDIVCLNDFIRRHMLEAKNWDEKVERLLRHFMELSEAHDSLLRVRQQAQMLEPIATNGQEFRRLSMQLDRAEKLLAAVDAYFSQRTIDLFTPALEQRQSELEQAHLEKENLMEEIRGVQERIRTLRNEIDIAGGARLREIPVLIEKEAAAARTKRQADKYFRQALERIGMTEPIVDEVSFTDFKKRLPAHRATLEAESSALNAARDQRFLDRAEIRQKLAGLRAELEGLNQRRENIPEWCVALRQSLCQELGLSFREFPFAAELMQVLPEERRWEASIEKVLHSFALSLLVPEKFYHLVAGHVDRTRLAVQGVGKRLVYLRVTDRSASDTIWPPRSRTLGSKLKLKEGHVLLPWLKTELLQRFDYLCCDTVEEFQEARGQAMTANRHVKSGNYRHDKDDRDHIVDPRNFVLGWENREKKQLIAKEIGVLEKAEAALSNSVESDEARLDGVRDRLSAVSEAQRVETFAEIDFARHEAEMESLEQERRAIEEKTDAIRVLKKRLAATEAAETALHLRRDSFVARESELEREISDGKRLLGNAQADLQRRKVDGSFADCCAVFPDLDTEFSSPPLSMADIFQRKDSFRTRQGETIGRYRKALDPIRDHLLEAMSRFLRICTEETDLRATVEYLETFLGLRKRIIEDDLPRHTQRFKERLNKKVIEEIGLFRNALEQERRNIEDKIELLNVSLKKLEYRLGTHIQLEPRPIRDADITEFQGKLRECVEGSFDDSADANEARFVRIKEFVGRLRDEDNRAWRNKVTDVGRWFDFVANVIDRQTLKSVSVYQDSSGQSGGEKAKLAFTILVAAIAYQYDLDPEHPVSNRFQFVVVDEMFSKVDDKYAEYALELFKQFGLQLLIVAPLDAKARVTQPYVGSYLHVIKKDNKSAILEMTAKEFEDSVVESDEFVSV